jgi:predicted HicB family RNase H-like nuclease
MNTMIYKGYAARIEYSEEDGCFVGHLAGIRDIVGFDGKTVNELKKRFHKAVDDYLWACEQFGSEPNKPFSGRLLLRVPADLHARASVAAQVTGMSLNQWATRAIEQAVEGH